jgi:hypothetical protein
MPAETADKTREPRLHCADCGLGTIVAGEWYRDMAANEEETPIMIADENRKFDQEMLAALTRLGFEIENGGISAYAEVSVIIGDDMDFRLQMVTDNGARVIFRRVAREQILSFAKAVDPEDDAVVGLVNRADV